MCRGARSEPAESEQNLKCGAVRRAEPKLNCLSPATLLSGPTRQVADRDGSLDYVCEKRGATSGREKANKEGKQTARTRLFCVGRALHNLDRRAFVPALSHKPQRSSRGVLPGTMTSDGRVATIAHQARTGISEPASRKLRSPARFQPCPDRKPLFCALGHVPGRHWRG